MAMPIAKMILAGASALCMFTSIASADPLTGRVMGINRLTNTIAIQPIQNGTIGTNTGGSSSTACPAEEYQVQGGVSLDSLHAEDRLTYTLAKPGAVKPT